MTRWGKVDILIDDNPEQVKFGKKYGYEVFVVKSFLASKDIREREFIDLYLKIKNIDSNIFYKLKKLLFG